MTTITVTDKTTIGQIKFVNLAIAKDKLRPVFTAMYYDAEEKALIGSDSRRLHILRKEFELETGYYKMIKDGKSIMLMSVEIGEQYVDYKQIILKEFAITKTMLMPKDETIAQSKLIAIIYKAIDENACVNISYIQDVTIASEDVNVSINTGLSPIMIEYPQLCLSAIIMPILIKTTK